MRFLFIYIVLPFFAFAQHEESRTVYFKFNRSDLDSVSRQQLSAFIHGKKITHVSVSAHCDSIGGNAYNDGLSMRRAAEVKKYFVQHSISDTLIDIHASGKKNPLNKNLSESERSANRRAEIRMTVEDIQTAAQPVFNESTVYPDERIKRNDSTILNLQDVDVGSTFKLENINFYGGRHVWLPRSEKTLQQLLHTLQKFPTLEIEIQGHICCMVDGDGPDFDAGGRTGLSVNRARAIYDYLIRNGIDPGRLSYKGFGADRKLIPDERTESDRESNRRVEIMVIKK